jgi:hypothetical protein
VQLKVQRVFRFNGRVIFDVEILSNEYYNIGNIFENEAQNLGFELLGIGMDNQTESKNKSFLVKPFISSSDLDAYLGQVFIKKV